MNPCRRRCGRPRDSRTCGPSPPGERYPDRPVRTSRMAVQEDGAGRPGGDAQRRLNVMVRRTSGQPARTGSAHAIETCEHLCEREGCPGAGTSSSGRGPTLTEPNQPTEPERRGWQGRLAESSPGEPAIRNTVRMNRRWRHDVAAFTLNVKSGQEARNLHDAAVGEVVVAAADCRSARPGRPAPDTRPGSSRRRSVDRYRPRPGLRPDHRRGRCSGQGAAPTSRRISASRRPPPLVLRPRNRRALLTRAERNDGDSRAERRRGPPRAESRPGLHRGQVTRGRDGRHDRFPLHLLGVLVPVPGLPIEPLGDRGFDPAVSVHVATELSLSEYFEARRDRARGSGAPCRGPLSARLAPRLPGGSPPGRLRAGLDLVARKVRSAVDLVEHEPTAGSDMPQLSTAGERWRHEVIDQVIQADLPAVQAGGDALG